MKIKDRNNGVSFSMRQKTIRNENNTTRIHLHFMHTNSGVCHLIHTTNDFSFIFIVMSELVTILKLIQMID